MARQTLVLDASIGVKWFSPYNESALLQALAIRDAHVVETVLITVPDLFYYEVANAIVYKKLFPVETIQSAVAAMFALNLETVQINSDLLMKSVKLSRQFDISIYDACYAVAAIEKQCPLVTANPRHQGHKLGCRVIPIEKWKMEG
jgi:predicted nucleic acid-binding protein